MPKQYKSSDVSKYQDLACGLLGRVFGRDNAIKEWDVTKGTQDAYVRDFYHPRLDIAVGPFSIDGNIEHNQKAIDRTVRDKLSFIRAMCECSEVPRTHFRTFLKQKNKNPRCFLAIEIEKSGSRKHMLGDIANVSILGSIGIIIPFDDKRLSAFIRIQKYLNYAANVGKTENYLFKNVLILTKANFLNTIKSIPHYINR